MKKLAILLILLSIFSCSTTRNTGENQTTWTIEMIMVNGETITETHSLPSNVSLFIKQKNKKSWLVYIPNNCDECAPTIIKNRVVEYKIHI